VQLIYYITKVDLGEEPAPTFPDAVPAASLPVIFPRNDRQLWLRSASSRGAKSSGDASTSGGGAGARSASAHTAGAEEAALDSGDAPREPLMGAGAVAPAASRDAAMGAGAGFGADAGANYGPSETAVGMEIDEGTGGSFAEPLHPTERSYGLERGGVREDVWLTEFVTDGFAGAVFKGL
jgi:hypothetical protein